jgi:probable phosphoglycerate mutase
VPEPERATRALLLRHGESASNAAPDAIALPQEAGDRLSERGREQAHEAAEGLRECGATRLLCSPMRRTRETAAPLTEVLGLQPEVLPYLHELKEADAYGEMDLGEQQRRRWARRIFEHRDDPDHGEDGEESFNAVLARVGLAKAEFDSRPGETSLLVSHGIFMRFFLFDTLLGPDFGPAHAPSLWNMGSRNCGLSTFERAEPRRQIDPPVRGWTCLSWMEQPSDRAR